MRDRCLGLAFALLVAGGSAGTIAAPVPATKPVPRWEPLLAWLPENTETLIVAPMGIEFPKDKCTQKDEKISFIDMVQSLPTGPLLNFKDGILKEQLGGQKVFCVVEGSRRFTEPKEFGLMPYEGCHILQFDPTADAGLKKVFQTCLDKADKKIELAGQNVAVFVEDPAWSYFVCRPRPGILMCATNRGYLEETLKRIDKPAPTRALPADLPEWKHVDVKARLWAIRHYLKEFAKDDPSSPLIPQAPANVPDPEAVGLVFWISDERESVAKVRYLTGAKEGVKIATSGWELLDLKPKVNRVTPEAIEITIPVTSEENGAMFYLLLMMRLGHGIYC